VLNCGADSDLGLLALRTLYLQGEGRLDFSAWNAAIGGAAGGGGTGLQEQQMSRGDIPIIVDACISFVTQHGEWALVDTEPVGVGWDEEPATRPRLGSEPSPTRYCSPTPTSIGPDKLHF
jgi:hypothetical protein